MSENEGDVILFTTEDGKARITLQAEGGTMWLSQVQIADLFATTKQNVSLHTKNILEDDELAPVATVREYLTVQTERAQQFERLVTHYDLDCRINS
ncbi:MAG: hypothetical protein ACRBCL_02580 [Maritimibacter sp.]